MSMSKEEIIALITESIPDAQVKVQDLSGDGEHYAVSVIAEAFRGKSRIAQHRMVFEALRCRGGGMVHALSVHTDLPPSE